MSIEIKLSGLVGLLKTTRAAIEASEEYDNAIVPHPTDTVADIAGSFFNRQQIIAAVQLKPTAAEGYGFLGKLLSCFLEEADDPYLVRNALERVESSEAFTDFCVLPYVLYSLLYTARYSTFHEYCVRLGSNPFKRYGITSGDLQLMVPTAQADEVAKQLALLNTLVASSKDISSQVCKK